VEPEAGFTPAVTPPATTKQLQAWQETGWGSAGKDLRPYPRHLEPEAGFTPAVTPPATTKQLQAWQKTGWGSAGKRSIWPILTAACARLTSLPAPPLAAVYGAAFDFVFVQALVQVESLE
jgi:hypothetical protein